MTRIYSVINPRDLDDLTNQINVVLARMSDTWAANAWPVGALFITSNNVNPATTRGGTWELLYTGAAFSGYTETVYLWTKTKV